MREAIQADTAPQPRVIGARDAQRILGISRAALHRIAKMGILSGKLVDRPGEGRVWKFKRSDVVKLKSAGTALRRKPVLRKIRLAWVRAFGPIPEGLTVATRDGNGSDLRLQNLSLIPLTSTLKRAERTGLRRVSAGPIEWTRDQVAKLRREFATRPTSDIAHELGCSLQAVRCKARRLRLRKTREYIIQRSREARRLPLGTERVDRSCDILIIKVSHEGAQRQQWRPKHHVIWEQANHRSVPPGMRVVFKDRDKRNFDPANLELATRDEISALAFAQFQTYPEPLKDVIRLNTKLGREIQKRMNGDATAPRQKAKSGKRAPRQRRWTEEMDEILARDYPTKPVEQVRVALGVSVSSLRQRARRMHIRRLPETMIAEARAAGTIERQRHGLTQEQNQWNTENTR